MKKFLFFLILFVIISGGFLSANNLDAEIKLLERFSSAYHIIQEKHISGIPTSKLINASIKGMVEALDEHSQFLSKEEFELLEGQAVGRFVGIGVTMVEEGGNKKVSHVAPNSPAAKEELRTGDIIVAVNGQKLIGLSLDDLKQLTIGKVGSKIQVTFKHPAAPETEIVKTLIREKIDEKSVRSFDKEKALVLHISSFQKGTPSEVKKILQNKGKRRVIIDLRDNPGGLLISAVETVDLFVDAGKIVEVKDKFGRLVEKYVSTEQRLVDDQKPILLINHRTASAAEILAGTLKDRSAGILVGSKSYGKGTVQALYPISNEYFLKLTSALYYTPSGVSFDGIGIEPDVAVIEEIDLETPRYTEQDKAYQKALSLLE